LRRAISIIRCPSSAQAPPCHHTSGPVPNPVPRAELLRAIGAMGALRLSWRSDIPGAASSRIC
jgi:hypothetical protein